MIYDIAVGPRRREVAFHGSVCGCGFVEKPVVSKDSQHDWPLKQELDNLSVSQSSDF